MRRYEGLFIFPPQEAPEAGKEEEKRLEEILHRFGGRTLERRDWGRRPLGYPLKKFQEGRVFLWDFELESHQLAELRKALQVDGRFLRSMIVKFTRPKPAKDAKKKHDPAKERPKQEGEVVRGR